LKFEELLYNVRRRNSTDWKPPSVLLALDPGETLGWAMFKDGRLYSIGQEQLVHNRESIDFTKIEKVVGNANPSVVVCEGYRVYPWKRDAHVWAELITPRIIGAIEMVCSVNNIPLYFQSAAAAKGFCSNKKLKNWGYYHESFKHGRDAVRHGCYWLLFCKEV